MLIRPSWATRKALLFLSSNFRPYDRYKNNFKSVKKQWIANISKTTENPNTKFRTQVENVKFHHFCRIWTKSIKRHGFKTQKTQFKKNFEKLANLQNDLSWVLFQKVQKSLDENLFWDWWYGAPLTVF